MKRKRTIHLAVTLMVMLVPLALSAVNTIIYTATYGSSGMTVGADTLGGVTYTTVNYGDLFNDGEPGKPSLPIDYLKFSVPYNATNFSVTATLSNNMTQYIDHLVYPCQAPRMMSDTTPVVINLPDSSVYYTNSFYPSQPAWVVDEGFLAGENHIVTVAVMPIAYKHKTGTLTSNNQLRRSGTVRLTLHYDLSDSLAMYPIVRNDTALRREGYRLTQSMVVNPTNVEAYAPDIAMDTMIVINPNSGDGLNVDPVPIDPIDPNPGVLNEAYYPYLIVTTPELKHSLRRLAALKLQKGYGVKIVTMDEVMNSQSASQGDIIKREDSTSYVAFNDPPGKLRQYLRNAYKYWGTQYVLLAGTGIPYRKILSSAPSAKIIDVISDLYYCDINGNWSTTNGEQYIDRDPEMYVGRILATRQEQIRNYTDKLLRYELKPGGGNFNYLKRILFTDNKDMSEHYCVAVINYFYKNIFTEKSHLTEIIGAPYPTGNQVVDTINANQFGYISFNNHACPSGILTSQSKYNNSFDRYLWAIDSVNYVYNNANNTLDAQTGNALNNFNNKGFPCIGYSIGCTTMPYDTIPEYSLVHLNFGESFTTGKDYGGPAFLGNTREGDIEFSNGLERLFAQRLSSGINYKIGELEAFSKFDFNKNDYICEIHNLLGDPEFEIWTDIPQQFTNISITRTDNSITVSGITVDSTTVAIYSNDGSIRSVLANPPGITRYISPNSTVMVYKHNYIPYIAPLLLQNVDLSKSQYVIAGDVTAGNAIDCSNRPPGDVTVKSGIEYEIEASGTVTLQDGFRVEKGATFAVYPSCF